MTGGHVYIDESTQGDYLIICSAVPSGDVAAARKAMRSLLLPNQRSLHMKNERRSSRQEQIVSTVLELRPTVTIYRAKPSQHGGHVEARAACLRRASSDAVDNQVEWMVLDKCDSFVARDKSSILQGAGQRQVPFEYHHMKRHEEVLLSLPDIAGWFYAKGGAHRARIAPIVVVENL